MTVRRRTACRGNALPLGVLLATLALAACREAPASGPGRAAAATGTTRSTAPGDAYLEPLVERLPADIRWAVLARRIGPAGDRLDETLGLLGEHPGLSPWVRQLRTRWEDRLGIWPFDPAGRKALGLAEDAPVALYRRPASADGQIPAHLGLLVGGVRPTALASAITGALQRRGKHPVTTLQSLRVEGRLLLRVLGRWTCGFERGWTRCVEVLPARWARAVAQPSRGLRQGALRRLAPSDLRGGAALYLAALPVPWPEWAAVLVSTRPKALWITLALTGRPKLRALLLGGPPPAAAAAGGGAPPPRRHRSGLGAATGSEVVARLSLAPSALLALLRALGPAGHAVAALLQPSGRDAPPGVATVLSGEAVLMSWPEGLGAVLGLRDRAAATRALATLDLRLARRLPGWQRTVREHGPGWNLTLDHQARAGRVRHGLVLQLPAGKTSPFPTVRDGRVSLLWGLTDQHLILATNPRIFRRLQAQASAGEAAFLTAPTSADRRHAFDRPTRLALALRPDDPYALLPRRQQGALRRLLADQAPTWQAGFLWMQVLADLLHEVTLSVVAHPAGALVEATLGLASSPGAASGHLPWADPTYREALRRKWGGNTAGHAEALRALGRDDNAGWLQDKARRNLASPEATLRSGLFGLTASALLPWYARRRHHHQRREALRRLEQLGAKLRAEALRAAGTPGLGRRRWHRGLQTTPLTPVRRCCASPDRRCRSATTDWRHPTWRRLGFQITGRHRYRYEVLVHPGSVRTQLIFRAVGDLDCDGRSSLLELPAQVDESTGALTLGEVKVLRSEPRTTP